MMARYKSEDMWYLGVRCYFVD